MIVHTIHVPVSANRFVAPVVAKLRQAGMPAELWVAADALQSAHLTETRSQCPVRDIACDLSMNPLVIARRLWVLVRAMSQPRPNAVHAHQMRAAVLPLLAAWLLRVPVRIYHNHGLPYLGYNGALRGRLRLLERINIALSTHMLLVSHSNRDAARNDGLLRKRQGRVLGRGSAVGINLKHWPSPDRSRHVGLEFRRERAIAAGAFVVLFVGRANARKGFIELIAAWEKGCFASRGCVLLCAGFGPEAATSLDRPLPTGVVPLGMLQDLRPVYAACDVLCLPSWHEGLSYAVLEAYAASRPVIVTDIPGLRSEVLPGLTGLSVPVRDIVALTTAIRHMETDPIARQSMGRKGWLFVRKCFDQRQVLDKYAAWYRHILHFSSSPKN